ncbi:hypothetical protein TKK_0008113 [Trichogramma kaykai]|uniref:F-box domain-containing protein n=1 Tax=Trichogramma kaykai TaxID=54128 RepID=A0ABD2X7K9_9HYME
MPSVKIGRYHEPEVQQTEIDEKLNIVNFPEEILQIILSYLNFHSLAKIRLVCKRFKNTCETLLNLAYFQIRNEIEIRYNYEKQMPRKLPLSSKSQIIIFLSEELQQLNCWTGSHLKNKCCCFFAGKLLDESYSLLKLIKSVEEFSDDSNCRNIYSAFTTMNKFFILQKKFNKFLKNSGHYQICFN